MLIDAEDRFVVAFLGLGANLDDREEHLKNALAALHRWPGVEVVETSSVYETEPWGRPDQPAFLNLACRVHTSLSPQDLLMACQAVENAQGRVREEKWGPRTIDIDILLYGQETVTEPDLLIPHQYLCERAFVLVPLGEIAPNWPVPGKGTVQACLEAVTGREGVRVFGPPPWKNAA